MSWAAHNPELYDELCAKGIARKLAASYGLYGGEDDSNVEFTFLTLVEALHDEAPAVYDALLTWAEREVGAEVSEYWAGLIDVERVRRKEGA